MGATHVSRLEVGPANRALVILALLLNAAIFFLFAISGFVWGALPLCILPAVLLTLPERPRAFRALAGLLGALYAVWGVWGFFFGGWVFVPAAALLLWAALVPWVDPAQPWRRRAWCAAAVFSIFLAPIAVLGLWSLLLR